MKKLVERKNKNFDDNKNDENYQSRFLKDYDVIDLLGAVSLIYKPTIMICS